MTNAIADDEHTIGSPDDVWQVVKAGKKEAFVKTNGYYFDRKNYSSPGFHTYIVTNLPESNIVGAPQSMMNDVEGGCRENTYHILGTVFFAGKDRSGLAMNQLPPEEIIRKVTPNSLFAKAFGVLCKTAETKWKEQF